MVSQERDSLETNSLKKNTSERGRRPVEGKKICLSHVQEIYTTRTVRCQLREAHMWWSNKHQALKYSHPLLFLSPRMQPTVGWIGVRSVGPKNVLFQKIFRMNCFLFSNAESFAPISFKVSSPFREKRQSRFFI